jgi:hypothetical protein
LLSTLYTMQVFHITWMDMALLVVQQVGGAAAVNMCVCAFAQTQQPHSAPSLLYFAALDLHSAIQLDCQGTARAMRICAPRKHQTEPGEFLLSLGVVGFRYPDGHRPLFVAEHDD